jgi:hypothetical protein
VSGSTDKTLCLWQLQRRVGSPQGKKGPGAKDKKQPVGQRNELPAGSRFEQQDRLTKDDPRDTVRTNMYCKRYPIHFKAGKTYQIDMVSNQGKPVVLDPYLRLEDAGGGFPNARIVFPCQKAGTYCIICTTFAPNTTGPYTLTVQER